MIVVVLSSGYAQAQSRPQPRDLELARQFGLTDAHVNLLLRHGSDLHRLRDVVRKPAAGVTVAVPERRTKETVRALRTAFGRAHVVFQSEQNFGRGPDRVAVLRSSDPFDALRTMGTNGTNYGIDTDSVITHLRQWDRRYGLTILGAGLDWVEMDISRAPLDWIGLAREVYRFCPDVVEQGTLTVEALAAAIKKSRTIYLWWD